jgi:hypothetical protein
LGGGYWIPEEQVLAQVRPEREGGRMQSGRLGAGVEPEADVKMGVGVEAESGVGASANLAAGEAQ